MDTDSDIRLCRRLKRDTVQRGRTYKSVLEQHQRHVQPAFKFFIAPTMVFADLIVPRGMIIQFPNMNMDQLQNQFYRIELFLDGITYLRYTFMLMTSKPEN